MSIIFLGSEEEYLSAISNLEIPSRITVAMTTWVCYDFVLNFSEELDLIWSQRWSLTTAAYLIVRYGGMAYAAGTAGVSYSMHRECSPGPDGLPLLVDGIYYGIQGLSTLFGPIFEYQSASVPCYTLLVFTNTIQMALIFCLQGLITMRVRALYRQGKAVTYMLYGFFAVSQVGNVVSTVDTFIASDGKSDNSNSGGIQLLSGVLGCKTAYSTSSWAFFTFVIATISFEIVAVSLALYRLWTHYRLIKLESSMLWKSNDLFHLVARENLVYFCASAACMLIVGLEHTGGYNETSTTVIGLRLVLETFWLTMFGPYLILNIRRHDADRINGYFFASSHTMSAMVFAPRQGRHLESD